MIFLNDIFFFFIYRSISYLPLCLFRKNFFCILCCVSPGILFCPFLYIHHFICPFHNFCQGLEILYLLIANANTQKLRLFLIPEALQTAFPKSFDFLCLASAVQHRKFITAHSVRLTILRCHFFQHRPKAPQILIPDIMPVLIVDRFEIVQIQMNYADWDNPLIQSGRLYEVLRKYDMPFLVMEPVKGGSLASAGKEIEAEMKRVHPDASIASWALRFAASLPGVATVLSGMSNEEQMEDNIKTFRNFVPLNEEEKAVIAKAQEALKKSPAVPCTACRYCCDGCPMGIAIPDVFKALNTIRLYGEEDRAKNYYKKLLETSGKAEDCVQCGQCESVCPQHLPIIDLLKEASEKLDVPVTE